MPRSEQLKWPVWYLRVRVLVTNDDGVHAPGLGALARRLAEWVRRAPDGAPREAVVVAPLANQSGASAAVGTVYEREEIRYQAVALEGAEDIPTFGIDGSPALAVIVTALGGFGPRPDVVLSGINHGVNVGRSILHSGTVGAILTGSQFSMRGIAVSMRSGATPMPWDSAAELAVALLDPLLRAPRATLWNLNVPYLPLEQLSGVRRGHIGPAGIVRGALDPGHPDLARRPTPGRHVRGAPVSGMRPGEAGALVLQLGAAVPTLGDVGEEDVSDDAALVAAGYASVSPLLSVREDTHGPTSDGGDHGSLEGALELLGELVRRRAGAQ